MQHRYRPVRRRGQLLWEFTRRDNPLVLPAAFMTGSRGHAITSGHDVVFATPAQTVRRAAIWASVEIVLVTLSTTRPECGGPW